MGAGLPKAGHNIRAQPEHSLVGNVLAAGSAAQRVAALGIVARLVAHHPQQRAALAAAVAPHLPELVQAVIDAGFGAATGANPLDDLAAILSQLRSELTLVRPQPVRVGYGLPFNRLGAALDRISTPARDGPERTLAEYNLAYRLYENGEYREAIGHARSAVERFTRTSDAASTELVESGYALNLLAVLQHRLGMPEARQTAHQAVLSHIRTWDGSETSQVGTAVACNTLGVLLQRDGLQREAEHWLAESHRIAASLAAWKPDRYTDILISPIVNLTTARKAAVAGPADAPALPVSATDDQSAALLAFTRAWAVRQRDPHAALAQLSPAIAVLRRLTDLAPDRFADDLGHALALLASILETLGKQVEAAGVWMEAANVQAAADADPSRSRRLAGAHELAAAQLLATVGKSDEAVNTARHALARWQHSDAATPDPDHAFLLARCARILAQADHLAEASRHAAEAVAQYGELARGSTAFLADLALALCVHSLIRYDAGEHAEATALARQAAQAADRYSAAAPEPARDVAFAHMLLQALIAPSQTE